ncbi:hypothetical protein ANO11243_009640 [Dothideomycetidae sp. 11243]|nr:hypothetical protein ANO11243_009640 [fungal sp. No.11243]
MATSDSSTLPVMPAPTQTLAPSWPSLSDQSWDFGGGLDFAQDWLSWTSPCTPSLVRQPGLPVIVAFESQPLLKRQPVIVRKMILAKLKSWPYMMLTGPTGPPFVHELQMTEGTDCSAASQADPLRRGEGIMSLWSAGNKTAIPYLCSILRMELERIDAEISTYNDRDAVAALQAVTVYSLIRCFAGDQAHFDFDIPHLQTMVALCGRVSGVISRHCDPAARSMPSWEGWALAESLRRTLVLLLALGFLFELTVPPLIPGCDHLRHWSGMLLPCAKQLWEAKTRSDWEKAYHDLDNDRRLTIGKLFGHSSLAHPDATQLDRWLGQVDDFGTLIVLVASLVEGG